MLRGVANFQTSPANGLIWCNRTATEKPIEAPGKGGTHGLDFQERLGFIGPVAAGDIRRNVAVEAGSQPAKIVARPIKAKATSFPRKAHSPPNEPRRPRPPTTPRGPPPRLARTAFPWVMTSTDRPEVGSR